MLPEVLANHGCPHVEAELVFLDPRNDVEDFMAVLVESDRLGGIACQGLRVIISFSPIITPGTTETSYSVPWKLTRSLLVTLRLSGSAIANWRHTSTLGAFTNWCSRMRIQASERVIPWRECFFAALNHARQVLAAAFSSSRSATGWKRSPASNLRSIRFRAFSTWPVTRAAPGL
ncbi:hypothetical protein P4054_29365 [Pseudomonas aeruginosa]|nr:hypothetical protein [Pseudomonas aeruginosa]